MAGSVPLLSAMASAGYRLEQVQAQSSQVDEQRASGRAKSSFASR